MFWSENKMKLKTTSEYALRILTYMSNHESEQLTAKHLSEKLEIPYKYLTRVMTNLTKKGLVCSTRGRMGGFVFSKPIGEITIYDILEAVNDINNDTCIMGSGLCGSGEHCVLHDSWSKPKQLIDEMFKNSTLKDLQKQN